MADLFKKYGAIGSAKRGRGEEAPWEQRRRTGAGIDEEDEYKDDKDPYVRNHAAPSQHPSAPSQQAPVGGNPAWGSEARWGPPRGRGGGRTTKGGGKQGDASQYPDQHINVEPLWHQERKHE